MNGYCKTQPRPWTQEQTETLLLLKAQGLKIAEIAQEMHRSISSVSIKLKRLSKTADTYNAEHLADKYEANSDFFRHFPAKTILDLYAGKKSFWSTHTRAIVTTNDADHSIKADYNEKAERLIHRLYYEGQKFDLIDLDPFGSAYECFDTALKMARKGLIITFGEMGHKRFKRLDFVHRYYGIDKLQNFTTHNLIAEVQRIAARQKKKLLPVIIKEWRGISRVYFTIEKIKITEQWENRDKGQDSAAVNAGT